MTPTRMFTPLIAMVALTACSQSSQQAGNADNEVQAVPGQQAPLQPTPQPEAAQREYQACMIAGEFNIAGQIIRSRDCVQAAASAPKQQFRAHCEGLAQTSAQLGGEAGQVTYMDACPSPNQGRCSNYLRSGYDAFYYERSTDDLAELPESCSLSGGTWGG